METFGKQFKRIRMAAGLSQGQIADKLGLRSAQYISNVERDKCPLATAHFRKIAKMVGVPAAKSLLQTAKRQKLAEYDDILK